MQGDQLLPGYENIVRAGLRGRAPCRGDDAAGDPFITAAKSREASSALSAVGSSVAAWAAMSISAAFSRWRRHGGIQRGVFLEVVGRSQAVVEHCQ